MTITQMVQQKQQQRIGELAQHPGRLPAGRRYKSLIVDVSRKQATPQK